MSANYLLGPPAWTAEELRSPVGGNFKVELVRGLGVTIPLLTVPRRWNAMGHPL